MYLNWKYIVFVLFLFLSHPDYLDHATILQNNSRKDSFTGLTYTLYCTSERVGWSEPESFVISQNLKIDILGHLHENSSAENGNLCQFFFKYKNDNRLKKIVDFGRHPILLNNFSLTFSFWRLFFVVKEKANFQIKIHFQVPLV